MSTLEEIECIIKSELEEAQYLVDTTSYDEGQLYHIGRVNQLRTLLRMLEPLKERKENE